jgi:periplasmic divalent cation tolerance protein
MKTLKGNFYIWFIGEKMAVVIYSTIGDIEDARRIAHTLVEEQLVACVNIIPSVESVYRWEGKKEEDEECIFISKTSDENIDKAIARIKSLHPYELPDIIVIPIIGGLKEYIDYIKNETS